MEAVAVSYCLDTHAVIWSVTADPRLGSRARNVISEGAKGKLLVPDVVLLEISMLLRRGRIVLKGDGITFLSRVEELFEIVPINARIADLAAQLELPHGDPFDRVITATAKVNGTPLLTRDRAITDSGVVEIVW
jgi:PIN domain nuclease of toxin-antitoxin system